MISKSMHGVWSTTTLPSSRQRKKPITTVTWVIRYGGLGVAIVVEPLEIVGGSSRRLCAISPGRTMGPWFEMHLVCLASGLAALSLFLYQSATLYRASAPTLSLPLPADPPIQFLSIQWWGPRSSESLCVSRMSAGGSKGVNRPIDALTGELRLLGAARLSIIMAGFPRVDFMAISSPISRLGPNRLDLP
jgi:hypothetical protein